MKKPKDCCTVVNGACRAPANWPESTYPRMGSCFRCADTVCSNCSIRLRYKKHGRRRLCHNCIEDLDGNDARVFRHLTKLAGRESEREAS